MQELDDYGALMQTIDRVETEPARWLGERLFSLFNPKSVIDIGCASGIYLLPFRDRGCTVLGLDAEPRAGFWIPGRFQRADLRQPVDTGRFDLALCLEVAEHLQPEYADVLVENVAQSSDLIVWSAARPGQGGLHHHNEQSPEYWLDKFFERGFLLHPLNDQVRQEIRDYPLAYTVAWLIDNVRVLWRNDAVRIQA